MKLVIYIFILSLYGIHGQELSRSHNCLDVRDSAENKGSGHYVIYPQGSPMMVWCDMVSGGGGWTVFHRRFDGSVDFNQDWAAYKRGFGNVDGGEFWLGNDNIHALTTSTLMELRVDLEGRDVRRFAEYSLFALADENRKYMSTILGYKPYSTAGDSFGRLHSWRPFTTKDRDNDIWNRNCASDFLGAWWFERCHHSHLNGRYDYTPENGGTLRSYSSSDFNAMSWSQFDSREQNYFIKAASMKIRPIDSNTCRVKEGESFPFGECSATCGQGLRSRVFFCTFTNNGTRRFIRDEEVCQSGVSCPDNV